MMRPRLARAEAWPARPVRYVNGFPAGGATDTLSRIFCQKMTELSGQTFLVENKAGAGGIVGADAIAKSPPDGYTIGLGGIGNNVLVIGAYLKLPYRAAEDFTFISGIWQLPNILAARKDIPTTDLKEVIALLKKEPGKWTYATGGVGTTPHLSGEMFNSMAGVQVTHVPYKGGAPAMTDVLGGRVDFLFDNLPGVLPNVRAGLVKPIAVTAKARVPELPDVPAINEILPGYGVTSWIALIGPAGMSADLVGQINALSVKALADPGLKTRYNDLGAEPMPMTPTEVKAFRDSEEARLLPIMRAAGIKPE
jgi:tripartite-type tricarboxylate transporter receptor subunit TctC